MSKKTIKFDNLKVNKKELMLFMLLTNCFKPSKC